MPLATAATASAACRPAFSGSTKPSVSSANKPGRGHAVPVIASPPVARPYRRRDTLAAAAAAIPQFVRAFT